MTSTLGSCDVLVVGSGIAGLTAAVSAARTGARVTLAATGRLFSGASFYEGTWGLGCIAPADDTDAEDLARTILDVGCGMADPVLVRSFVRGIRPALDWLERDMGAKLMEPAADAVGERAYIPCFDHKNRMWRGFTHEGLEAAFGGALERLGVRVLPGCELVDILEAPSGSVAGAVLYHASRRRLQRLLCGAVVLATGGVAGLFERSLLPRDVASSAHGIALAHGCPLVNIEFIQIMPGLVHPRRGVVFNEKTFRYIVPARPLAATAEEQATLLEQRSGYGPYTSRLASRAVDEAIDVASPRGFPLRYDMPAGGVPELVRTFSGWLRERYGIDGGQELRLGLYAHAANGGIRIDGDGVTALPGLFACGEVTGGMHGADRIGGLASANALVFGRRAGEAAARYARERGPVEVPAAAVPPHGVDSRTAGKLLRRVRRAMTEHAMVGRTAEGLAAVRCVVEDAAAELEDAKEGRGAGDAAPASAMRLRHQLTLAFGMLAAMEARRESRGSHGRADAPAEDAKLAHPLEIRLGEDGSPQVFEISQKRSCAPGRDSA